MKYKEEGGGTKMVFLQQDHREEQHTRLPYMSSQVLRGHWLLANTYISVLSEISFFWHPPILPLILKYTSLNNLRALLSLSILKGLQMQLTLGW